jgi:hypothetical protein
LEILELANSNLKRCIFLLIQLQEWLIEIIFEALVNLILRCLLFTHPHNIQKRITLRMELLDSLGKHSPLTVSLEFVLLKIVVKLVYFWLKNLIQRSWILLQLWVPLRELFHYFLSGFSSVTLAQLLLEIEIGIKNLLHDLFVSIIIFDSCWFKHGHLLLLLKIGDSLWDVE